MVTGGQTLNSDIYCQQLDRLKLASDQKRPKVANRRCVFHQDNATPQTSVETRQNFRELAGQAGPKTKGSHEQRVYPHRPMTLHSPTENSLAVLNHKILEANSQVQNVKLGGHQTCLSINRLWHELCDMLRRLVGITAPGHHDCSIQE
ncbi:uncharacterized protein TNCV_934391 [Trichonephila clavipes]|nr:uncharacterized protein TNCV_934391 [Trichonephila clavipes]